jgi:flagellar hook-associated protein 1 FlgK
LSDLLAIGAAGVRAMQAALAQVGDNVANADTPGYVRRSVQLATGPSGAGTPLSRDNNGGAGVITGAITRSSDVLAVNSARIAAGSHARHAARSDWLDRLQTVLIGSDLDSRMGGVFDAGSDLAATPTSTAARTIFLDRMDQAASAFRSLGSGLTDLASDIADATAAATARINAITSAIGQVNTELRRTAQGGAAANGLLDSRDALLAELATDVRISVSIGPRGTATVRIGSGGGAALLVSAEGMANRIGAQDTGSGPELVLDPTHAAIAVQLPANGRLAGLMEAARQITATGSAIDSLATRFGTAINDWHRAGSDALGDPGGALLATRGLSIIPGRANAGGAAVDVRVSDDQLLSPGGYRLLRDATGWTLARADGSATTSGPGDLLLDGVSVRPGSDARDGDAWTLATTSGASGLSLRPIGPARLAVANRFIVDAAASNSGDATLSLVADASAAAFAAPPPWRVTINTLGQADITALGSGALLATAPLDGTPIIANGVRVTLSGRPGIGDSFRILTTGPASNDNGNALALGAVRSAGRPDGGFETSLDASAATVGSLLSESRRLEATSRAVRDDTARAVDAVSAVDLDREAAEMTRLQVAYRANAQLLAAAREMFDAMLAVLQ